MAILQISVGFEQGVSVCVVCICTNVWIQAMHMLTLCSKSTEIRSTAFFTCVEISCDALVLSMGTCPIFSQWRIPEAHAQITQLLSRDISTHVKNAVQCIAVALENYFPIPCKVSCPYAYFVWECMHMGTRLCREWENNFPIQLQFSVQRISLPFEYSVIA